MAATHEDSAMSDFSYSSHRRHQEYSYRLPTPPRIVVPPPSLSTEAPELNVGGTTLHDCGIDTSFLKELNMENIVQRNTLLDWSYDRRRHAQLVLPWLYLGPMTAAKDKGYLMREGITMILAIRSQVNSLTGALRAGSEVCQEVATIEASTYYALIPQFPHTTKLINQHIAKVRQESSGSSDPQIGKVLVFCESGNEKSAAVVAAYMMEVLDDFDHIKAMQVCQSQRFCVNFDDTIKNILRSYWDILKARRHVASSRAEFLQPTPVTNGSKDGLQIPPAKLKRTIEDTIDDEDIDMGDSVDPSDDLRFTDRANSPFQDS
ncbi:phosphatases II [Lindgomyces ingoldianus]|uniref:Phosphatases II n=1 Tax=Lindgomyces ingoldianus TaxID=673940 RepID=A0ACB6R0P0_9PLEO|nr:phosphatases II [Lindgomyces ingoldianus]KAF2472813.1 phosphatases II [Lindgomyces ingoldianus]